MNFTPSIRKAICLALPCIAMLWSYSPAIAQSESLEPRVKKLEAEMRAVQRRVFPGGSDRFFTPDVEENQSKAEAAGTVATTPLTDLLARVDALETQLASLTAQVEENSFRMGQIDERIAAVEAHIKAEEEAKAAALSETRTLDSNTGGANNNAAAPLATTSAADPSQERIDAVSAIIKPETDDAGEDSYIYGFRLWDAGFFPEAQQQLTKTVDEFDNHRRASHARNLLGRAYLDDKKPARAAAVFLDNYQTDPRGARAPDSLYFLGRSLIASNENEKACAAFTELEEAYPDIASGRLATRLNGGRKDAGCN